jgi:hypothetical protein
MEWEQEAADALGLNWQSLLIRPLGVSDSASPTLHELDLGRSGHDLATWVTFRRRYYALIADLRPKPDVILLRHNVHDPFPDRGNQGVARTSLRLAKYRQRERVDRVDRRDPQT